MFEKYRKLGGPEPMLPTFRALLFTLLSLTFHIALAADLAATKPGDCLWHFTAPHGRYMNLVYPCAAQGRAFLVSNSPTRQQENWVYGLDLITGATLWETDIGDLCAAEPALAGDRLIVTATDRFLKSSRTFCLDTRSGKILWKHEHGDWLTVSARPSICGDQVALVVCRKDAGPVLSDYSRLCCLELHDGYEVWNTNQADTARFSALSQASGGRVYFGMSRTDKLGRYLPIGVHSFETATGKLSGEVCLSKHATAGFAMLRPVLEDGRIYVRDNAGVLNVFDLAQPSTPLWSLDCKSALGPPAVSNGFVVQSLATGSVECLRASDGRNLWASYIDTTVDQPVIHNRQVLASSRQNVYAIRLETGESLWSFFLPKPVLDGRIWAEGNVALVPAAYNHEHIALYALKVADAPK